MFKAPNPYEDLVARATDEGLTSENWHLNLDLCDKLSDGDESNARLMIAAVQRRLTHKNTNVQLYALTLTDMLSKNCGASVHHEIASRTFMQTLSRLVVDRTTHTLVKKRVLTLLREWANEYKNDDTLSLVADTMHELKGEYFDADDDEVATTSNAEAAERLRREEEELQRVLALSVQDQGGRGAYMPPTDAESSVSAAEAPAASSSAAAGPSTASAAPAAAPAAPAVSVTPAETPAAPAPAPDAPAAAAPQPAASRPAFVRALYDFEPDEPGELAFSAGDVIRVLDSVYEQWWRGELRQEVGIFPVNYVEPMPDMSQAAIEQDLEMERSVFAHAADIHRLHARLQQLDPLRDNFVDDDELQELYQRSLALRPKIIRLMDRYSVKVQDLRAMNDKFMRARSTFEDLIAQRMEQYATQNARATETYAPGASSATYDAAPAAPAAMPTTSAASHVAAPGSSAASLAPSHAPSAAASSSAGPSMADFGPMPQEDEKRRLFERARAEVEAYQKAYHPEPEDTTESLAGLQLR
ncbi:hypothetical protein MOBT1_000365 [Malassezia obtusa]|uniref:Class E vacuolar protein-sorting machinery protein HSE1 n=1 Tax=Malassezia obtusa TaxID=76774 RepID=A0AAF0DXD6_9BASI|nr:hypothetical protein MOBT1_000365 [Malassezia obtusa]